MNGLFYFVALAMLRMRCVLQALGLSSNMFGPVFDLRSAKCLSVWFCCVNLAAISVASTSMQEKQSGLPQYWDVVEYRVDSSGLKKSILGVVADLNQRQLELQLESGVLRKLERAQVISVRLEHDRVLAEADGLANVGQFEKAIAVYQPIIQSKKSLWLRRYAAAGRVQAQMALGQYRQACLSFLTLAKSDPQQVPWDAAPLIWTSVLSSELLDQQTVIWLKSDDVLENLFGASYGLQNPKFSAASQAVLEKLSQTQEGFVQDLVIAQLWRLENQPTQASLDKMQAKLGEMDREIRAGPLLVLARQCRLARQDRKAVLLFLEVSTSYPQQHSLVLLGLDGAYLTLNSLNDPQSAIVSQWLRDRFPDSARADSARADSARADSARADSPLGN